MSSTIVSSVSESDAEGGGDGEYDSSGVGGIELEGADVHVRAQIWQTDVLHLKNHPVNDPSE